jgi:hypothetical protein
MWAFRLLPCDLLMQFKDGVQMPAIRAASLLTYHEPLA